MIPVRVQTLIVTSAPAPSVIVLQPIEEVPENENFRIVPIWIGVHEATQMGIALEKARFARPMTHDLFLDALTNLDARIKQVNIYDVNESTFFAKLILQARDRVIELDARPSDALALALRQEAPIYMEESVLERSSFPYVFKKNPNKEAEIAEFRQFVESLAPEDFEG